MPSPQSVLTNRVKLYAQRRVVDWEVDHLPPKTQIYLFINGQSYSQYAAPLGGALGEPIFSDEFGSARGQLTIPRNAEDKVLIGEIRITFVDNPTDLASTSFSAESTFYALGLEEQFNQDQGGTRTTRQPISISRIAGGALKEIDILSNNINAVTERLDLVSQTFRVDATNYPQGLFLSSVDLFFASKDSVLPVSVELRKTIDGIPVSNEYLSGTYVRKYPDAVNLPAQDVINTLSLPSIVSTATGISSTSELAKKLVSYLDTIEFASSYTIQADGNPIVVYQYSQDVTGRITASEIGTKVIVNLNSIFVTASASLPGYFIKRKNPFETYSLTAQADGTFLDPRNNTVYTSQFSIGANFMVRNGVLYKFTEAVPNTVDIFGLGSAQTYDQVNLQLTDFGSNLLTEAGVSNYVTTTSTIVETIFNTRAAPAGAPAVFGKTDSRWGSFMNNYAVWESNIFDRDFSRSYIVNFPVTGTYDIQFAADNLVSIYLDGDLIVNQGGENFGTSSTVQRTISAGTHTLAWNATNINVIGGFAMLITTAISTASTIQPTNTTGGLLGSGDFPATNFRFQHPIYLSPGTYALCVKTNSDQYNLATSRADLPLVPGSDSRTPESLSGSLFRATNLGSRLPDQNEDLAYVMYKYRFDTGTRSLILNNKTPGSPFRYDAFKLRSTTLEFPELAFTKQLVNHTDQSGISNLFENITVDKIVNLKNRKLIDSAGDSSLELIMTSLNPNISPVVDKEKLVGVMYRNEVDPYEQDTSNQELTPLEGIARARYVSKIVTLEPGFDSNGIEVRVDINRKVGTDIEVYAKVMGANDAESFAKRPWKRLRLVSNDGTKEFVGYSETKYVTEYYQALTPALEYEGLSLDGVPGLFKDFNRYMVKIVFYSNNPVYVPKIRNLFASACIDVPSQVLSALGPGATSSTALRLSDLSDVSDQPATIGQTIVWDGNQWIPSSSQDGGSLGDLVDVDTSAVAGPLGATTAHSLIWSPAKQIWEAVVGAGGSSGDARSASQVLSFGATGSSAFVPAKYSPAAPFVSLYPYTQQYLPRIGHPSWASPLGSAPSTNYALDGTGRLFGHRPARTIKQFGRTLVATQYTDIETLKAQGNTYRFSVVGVELLASIRATYVALTEIETKNWMAQSGNYLLENVDEVLFNMVIASPATILEDTGDGSSESSGFYYTSDDVYHLRSDTENVATVYNLSGSGMQVTVYLKVWNFCDEPIDRRIIQYNKSAGGTGATGYTSVMLAEDLDIAMGANRGSELIKTVTATVPPYTVSDFRFVCGGKQTGYDDRLFLIDYYVSFDRWL